MPRPRQRSSLISRSGTGNTSINKHLRWVGFMSIRIYAMVLPPVFRAGRKGSTLGRKGVLLIRLVQGKRWMVLGALALGISTRLSAMAPTESAPAPKPVVSLPAEPPVLTKEERPLSRENPDVLRQALLRAATAYASRLDVPYVWGGAKVGSPQDCQACRVCLEAKGGQNPEKRRGCEACSRCGVDCSHFVQRLFHDAGLAVAYLPTRKLKRLSAQKLADLGLIDMGKSLTIAEPGDLLVSSRHVVMLLSRPTGTVGDFIHVTRSIKRGHVGGIEVVRAQDLNRHRGRILRILRHASLLKPIPKTELPSGRQLLVRKDNDQVTR